VPINQGELPQIYAVLPWFVANLPYLSILYGGLSSSGLSPGPPLASFLPDLLVLLSVTARLRRASVLRKMCPVVHGNVVSSGHGSLGCIRPWRYFGQRCYGSLKGRLQTNYNEIEAEVRFTRNKEILGAWKRTHPTGLTKGPPRTGFKQGHPPSINATVWLSMLLFVRRRFVRP